MGTSYYPFGDDYEITGGVTTKYVTVDGLGVVAKRVGTGPAAVTYWLHADRLGSIQAVTNTAGAIVFRRQYRPYGETLAQSGSHTESRGWIDQRNDGESGLTYLHARYFAPQLGVFVSPDPSNPARRGVGVNRYTYAFANPVNGVDRNGLECGASGYGQFAGGAPKEHWSETAPCPAPKADVYDPWDALMEMVRSGMLLMDGIQKQLMTRKAIEQERRIMQADIDEQDRLAASQATQPVDDNKGTGAGQPAEPGGSNSRKAPSVRLAGGLGFGLFGVFAEVRGIPAGADLKIVGDSSFNLGLMLCAQRGLAIGGAFGGGAAVTGIVGSGSIHDLKGLSVQVEGGGGNGVFAKGSAGGDVSSNSAGVVGSVGLGAGVGGYGAFEAVGCKLLVSRR